jgi:nucleoside 2-deoxyribosyltransferase
MADGQRIFIAGPMFSLADINGQRAIDRVLRRSSFETYLAPRDGFEMRKIIEVMEDPSLQSWLLYQASLMVQHIGWCLEIHQVLNCDGVVLNLNGRVPDEGSVMEATLGCAAGKPVVTYKDSSITMWGLFDNPMVASLDRQWQPVRRMADLPDAMNAALRTRPARPYTYRAPSYLAGAASLGAFVEKNLDPLKAALTKAATRQNVTTALAALAPDLQTPIDLRAVRKFLQDLLAGTLLTPTPVRQPPSTRPGRWPVWLPRPHGKSRPVPRPTR